MENILRPVRKASTILADLISVVILDKAFGASLVFDSEPGLSCLWKCVCEIVGGDHV